MIDSFLLELCQSPTSCSLFNQYVEEDPSESRGNSKIRLINLKSYLTALLNRPVELMIIGESAGYNGAKCNGLHLFTEDYYLKLPGIRSVNRLVDESKTAKFLDRAFWGHATPLAFNIVPFFTHPENCLASNRKPSKAEIQQGSYFSLKLYQIFKPECVISMGRLAEMGLAQRGIKNDYLRHPSMGGQEEFLRGLRALM